MVSRRKSLYGMVTAAALSVMLVGPTLAQDTTTAVVTGGALSITAAIPVGDFAGKTIGGVAQTTTATMNAYTVSDLRGTGVGWKVNAVASAFTAPEGGVLANGSLVSSAWTVQSATVDGDSTDLGSKVLDNGAVRIASAAVNDGMGVYNFSTNLFTLSLPADVKAGGYVSTVTISVMTAP